jgi:glycosyltransferase involved in cell wall biosynthesis
MSLSPEQITIAVTVYNRRDYVKQAIASAINQTMPVRVMVVEDCGPDPTLEGFVNAEFCSRIEYFRSATRRGIFGNWNACVEQCRTEWLSILHDDDYLAPNFVEAMVAVEKEAPGLDLYFGQTVIVNQRGEPMQGRQPRPMTGRWKKIVLTDVIYGSPLSFPGQLFRVSSARRVGGFRTSSHYCGEWEMWAKLIARGGAAETSEYLGFFREHAGLNRGSNRVVRSGRATPAVMVQHKRVLALLSATDRVRFNRREYQRRSPMSVLFLVRFGHGLSPRLLRYYYGLLALSSAPHWRYALFQRMARLFGPGFIKIASIIWTRFQPPRDGR